MKNILLTTTAIVGFAGVAAAEGHNGVSFSGTASLSYNSVDDDGAKVEVLIPSAGDGDGVIDDTYALNAADKDGYSYGATLGLGYSQELDNGLTASASATVVVSDSSAGEDLAADSFGLALTDGTFTLSYGNNITPGATQMGIGNRAGAKDTYLGFNYADDMFAVALTRDANDAFSFGASAVVGGFTVTAGQQQASALVSSADGRADKSSALEAAETIGTAAGATAAAAVVTAGGDQAAQDAAEAEAYVAYMSQLNGDISDITEGTIWVADQIAGLGADRFYGSLASTNNAVMGFSVAGAMAGADLTAGYTSNTTTGRTALALSAAFPMGDTTIGGSYTMNTAGTNQIAVGEQVVNAYTIADDALFDGSDTYMLTATHTAGALTINAGFGTKLVGGYFTSNDDATDVIDTVNTWDDAAAGTGATVDADAAITSLGDDWNPSTAATDWTASVAYDMSPAVITVGLEDAGQDMFLGVAYDLGGGASLTAAYAADNDGDADAGAKIGGHQIGTSVGVSFTF